MDIIEKREEASFKDPDAKVFIENGIYVRKIYERYIPEYKKLMDSGLYNDLVSKNRHLLTNSHRK